jgi:hypothetical protein
MDPARCVRSETTAIVANAAAFIWFSPAVVSRRSRGMFFVLAGMIVTLAGMSPLSSVSAARPCAVRARPV